LWLKSRYTCESITIRFDIIIVYLIANKNYVSATFVIISLLPAYAFALAGIAERSSFFYYNDYTAIERGHPSDMCRGPSKWCLRFQREDHRDFKGIDTSIEEINVPNNSTSPYVILRRSSDEQWLVYDLENEQILITDSNYQDVLAVWNTLGLDAPIFVNAKNTPEYLTETEDSAAARLSMDLQMWLFMGVLPLGFVALLFWYLSRKSRQQYKKAGSKVFLVFRYVFLVPVFLFIYIALSSLLEIIWHNW